MDAHALIRQLAVEAEVSDLALDESGMARLRFDDRWSIDFEWDDGNRVLHLYAVAGQLPPEGREPVLLRLLGANVLGLETAGAAFAADAGSGEILLCTRVVPDSVSFEQFKVAIEGLLDTLDRLAPELLGSDITAAAPFIEPSGAGASDYLRA